MSDTHKAEQPGELKALIGTARVRRGGLVYCGAELFPMADCVRDSKGESDQWWASLYTQADPKGLTAVVGETLEQSGWVVFDNGDTAAAMKAMKSHVTQKAMATAAEQRATEGEDCLGRYGSIRVDVWDAGWDGVYGNDSAGTAPYRTAVHIEGSSGTSGVRLQVDLQHDETLACVEKRLRAAFETAESALAGLTPNEGLAVRTVSQS